MRYVQFRYRENGFWFTTKMNEHQFRRWFREQLDLFDLLELFELAEKLPNIGVIQEVEND